MPGSECGEGVQGCASDQDCLPGGQVIYFLSYPDQGGITCGAIDEPRKSSKAIDKRVIINFRDKNVIIARFRDKNEVFVLCIIYIIYKYIFYLLINTYTFLD